MDSSRSKKSRSLALESKTAASKAPQRPGPGERRTSAPTVARSRHSTAKPPSEGAKDASTTSRSLRTSTSVSKVSSAGRSGAGLSARPEERPRDSRPKARTAPQSVCQSLSRERTVVRLHLLLHHSPGCVRSVHYADLDYRSGIRWVPGDHLSSARCRRSGQIDIHTACTGLTQPDQRPCLFD